jgi:hypothetical protein
MENYAQVLNSYTNTKGILGNEKLGQQILKYSAKE